MKMSLQPKRRTKAELAELALDQLGQLVIEADEEKDNQIHLLSLALDIVPWPMWVKQLVRYNGKPAFRMLHINNAYTLRWNIKREEYVGKLDREVWGDEIGEAFTQNDLRAFDQAPKPYYTTERVPDHMERDAQGLHPSATQIEVPVWRITKVSTNRGERRYVMGIAWRDNLRELRFFHGGPEHDLGS